ncbi:MAG: RimK family alpha-L-glutamate ligase, partial [Bdellovibrionaceae bacterium]|nr:RimK family alpha-L-glutamate ligase [Pseudobdellovibrionaceae bacterium]
MEILILTRTPSNHSSQRFLQEGKALGHQVHLGNPEILDTRKIPADVIIPRFGDFRLEESLDTLRFFERKARRVLNPSAAFIEARHKWYSHLCLREEGIPQPESRLLSRSALLQERFSAPLVVKLTESMKGQGVFLVQNREQALGLPLAEEYLCQRFYPECAGRDLRVFVINNQVVAAMERRNLQGDFRANLSLGGQAFPVDLSPLEIELALRSTQALRLDYAGVDLIRTHEGPLVLEVNPSPGFAGLEKISGLNIA